MSYYYIGDIMGKKIIRVSFLLIILLFIYQALSILTIKLSLVDSNEEFIKMLLDDSTYYVNYKKSNSIFLSKLINFFVDFDVDKPTTILESSFIYNNKYEENNSYISNPTVSVSKQPLIYIYNSHQLEGYDSTDYKDYNITPNVMMASYLLCEKLKELGIEAVVEEGNITEFLRINNWDYSHSYEASRYYLKEAMNKYPSIKLFVDLHRDSINKQESTINIEGNNYAKLLFVVGLEHENYSQNLALANSLNKTLNDKYPGISRGVLTKKGEGVNGIYNQDLNPNVMLIEVGGYQNTIDEVLNSVIVVANILKEKIESGI